MDKILKAAVFSCAVLSVDAVSVVDVHAQAYVRQVSPSDAGAYIEQMPPAARPAETAHAPAKKAGAFAVKRGANSRKTAFRPFPSVGQGSTAIVPADADAADWPSVGRGAINK